MSSPPLTKEEILLSRGQIISAEYLYKLVDFSPSSQEISLNFSVVVKNSRAQTGSLVKIKGALLISDEGPQISVKGGLLVKLNPKHTEP